MDCGGMLWMRLPGQSWPGAAASFLLMWSPMMAAMMLPVLAPMLWRYRGPAAARRSNRLTALVAAGYFSVWSALGAAVFPFGALLAAAAMRWPVLARAAPMAAGVLLLLAGVAQFSAWKARQLACCGEAPGCCAKGGFAAAWRDGLHLGGHCALCCAGPTAVLFALGVMDPWAMALVTAAICAERLLPAGERVARAIGAVAVAAGSMLVLRAL